MKNQTVIVDFDCGMCWVLEEPGYQFDFNATHEAVRLLRNAMQKVAANDSLAFRKLMHAHDRLEKECAEYLVGR